MGIENDLLILPFTSYLQIPAGSKPILSGDMPETFILFQGDQLAEDPKTLVKAQKMLDKMHWQPNLNLMLKSRSPVLGNWGSDFNAFGHLLSSGFPASGNLVY